MKAVSHTAQWTAAARAVESERVDALFVDPYARTVAGDRGFELLEQFASPVGTDYLAIRTAFLDRVVAAAVADLETGHRGIRQIVFVAAGMDTRAYRLPWPGGATIFELDHAELLKAKEGLLAGVRPPRGVVHRAVPVDLAGPWEDTLTAAGLQTGLATLWVVEGLLYYLPEDAVRRLLLTIAGLSHPGSVLAGDLMNNAAISDMASRPFIKDLAVNGSPWQFGADRPEELLAECGWAPTGVVQPGEEGYGRWSLPVQPRHVPGAPRNFLFTAEMPVPPE